MTGTDNNDVTPGELGRRVDSVEKSVDRLREKVEQQHKETLLAMRDLRFVPVELYTSEREADRREVSEMKANLAAQQSRSWQVKLALVSAGLSLFVTVMAAVVLAALALK